MHGPLFNVANFLLEKPCYKHGGSRVPGPLDIILLFCICSEFVLEISDGFHDMGGLRWQLVLCLMGAWTLVFFCLIKGIKSQGKVS